MYIRLRQRKETIYPTHGFHHFSQTSKLIFTSPLNRMQPPSKPPLQQNGGFIRTAVYSLLLTHVLLASAVRGLITPCSSRTPVLQCAPEARLP